MEADERSPSSACPPDAALFAANSPSRGSKMVSCGQVRPTLAESLTGMPHDSCMTARPIAATRPAGVAADAPAGVLLITFRPRRATSPVGIDTGVFENAQRRAGRDQQR